MRASSPLKGAVLGLLIERPSYGYELANRLSARLGPAWQIAPKSIYPLLDQLERAGLAKSVVEPNPTSPRQQRTVYYPTEQAPAALSHWIGTSTPKEPLRADLQAKIAVARIEDAPRLLRMLDNYERECLELLEATCEEQLSIQSWRTLLMDLTLEAADAHLRAELEWVTLARRRIQEYSGRAEPR
jgi:DNA-binding PadR family transcriptional regulator